MLATPHTAPVRLIATAEERALELCRAIGDHLASRVGPKPQPVPWRSAQLALLYGHLARRWPGAYGASADELLERTFAELAEGDLQPRLTNGLAGVGFIVAHLSNVADAAEPIDDLLHAVVSSRWCADRSLPSGLVGLGMYALARRQSATGAALLREIIVQLAEAPSSAIEEVLFFGAALQAGVDDAAEPLAAALRASRGVPYPPHTLWSLWLIAQKLENVLWAEQLRSAACRAAKSLAPASGPGLDGAAGLLHVFSKLHQATGEPLFANAADHWLDVTLGSATTLLARDWSFATGITGVVLALLSATTDDDLQWEGLWLPRA